MKGVLSREKNASVKKQHFIFELNFGQTLKKKLKSPLQLSTYMWLEFFSDKGPWSLFLNGPSAASFSFIFIVSNKYYIFYNKYVWDLQDTSLLP